MPGPRPLTVKQRKFIANKAKGMSGAEAARQAGYSQKAAKEIASENLTKPNVRDAFLAAMDRAGITDEKLNQVMRDGLDANRTISAVTGTDATGKTMDFVDVPDHATRHKFLETAIDVKGAKAPKQAEVRVSAIEDLLDEDDAGPAPEAEEEA